jgi:hypothetical protein
MWQSDTDRQEAVQHARQVRSAMRVMLPIMDVASLVECTPEVARRRVAEHERSARVMTEHEVNAGERSPGVMTRLAAWVEARVAGAFRQRESSAAASKR